jgi:predicted O-linked N-acetylglucosamine transferase (SPINDLY family)
MPSLMELVERVNKGEMIDPEPLEVYEESPNSAEKFLAHHAHSMLDLRRAHQHMVQCLEAIDYSDQKVLNQFVSISAFVGQADLRCGPMVKFGSCAINRREYALGIEAIQNAVTYDLTHGGSYTRDRENCLFVAQQYERVAASIGWCNPHSSEWNHKFTRVAYVTSGLSDDDASGRMIGSLSRQYDQNRFKLNVYSTECGVRRERQSFAQNSYGMPSSKRGKETLEMLNKMKVSAWMTPLEGDTIAASKALADQLVRDQIDVVFFDCTQADSVAALCAMWDVARAKINLCRRTPMYSSGMQCICYFDQARFENDREFWSRRGVDSKYILEGVDLEETVAAAPNRSAYGIPDSAVVMTSCGSDLDRTMSDDFCDTIVNILRSHPQSIYLCVGDGELAAQKRRFESVGVGKRVGYAGKRKDLPGFLRMADVYLAEFPSCDAAGVLQAMSVERPVVAMRWGEAPEQSAGAAFAGPEATVSGRDASTYTERVSKLIREPAARRQLGKAMRERVEQQFAFTQTTRHLEQLCEQILQGRSGGSSDQMMTEGGEPLAQVA